MKNKNNIYVQVESKEQAETYRKVLEAMGEPLDKDFCHGGEEIMKLYLGKWLCGFWIIPTEEKITFGELIDLLQRKPLLVSVDGVELFEGDKLFEVSFNMSKSNPYLVNANSGVGYWTLDVNNNARWMLPESHQYHSKAFSTKQAALEWIESQKPKQIILEFGAYKFTINKDSVNVSHGDSDINIDIKAIYKAMEDLQNG